MKRCLKCGTFKAFGCFAKRGNGLKAACRDCQAMYDSAQSARFRVLHINSRGETVWQFRKCPTCGKSKPAREFYIELGRKSGLSGRCISCKSAYSRKRNTGVSPETFDAALKDQDGRCKICQTPLVKGKSSNGATADHCHKTGLFRGVLCNTCNLAIGKLGDDPRLLARAARYLAHQGSI